MVVGLYGAKEKTGGGAGAGRREATFLYTLHQQNIKHFISFLTTWDCASGIPGSTVWQLVDFVRFLHLLLSWCWYYTVLGQRNICRKFFSIVVEKSVNPCVKLNLLLIMMKLEADPWRHCTVGGHAWRSEISVAIALLPLHRRFGHPLPNVWTIPVGRFAGCLCISLLHILLMLKMQMNTRISTLFLGTLFPISLPTKLIYMNTCRIGKRIKAEGGRTWPCLGTGGKIFVLFTEDITIEKESR